MEQVMKLFGNLKGVRIGALNATLAISTVMAGAFLSADTSYAASKKGLYASSSTQCADVHGGGRDNLCPPRTTGAIKRLSTSPRSESNGYTVSRAPSKA